MDALQRFTARLQTRERAGQSPAEQVAVAAPEHAAFVQGLTEENPLAGAAVTLGAIPYALGKEAYFNPSWRGAINAALPEQVTTPMWQMLQRQVGHSRSQNQDPWGQIGAAFQGFGRGMTARLTHRSEE